MPTRTRLPASRRARLGAGVLVAAVVPLVASCADDPIVPFTKSEGTPPDARNYCAIVGVCDLFPDFGFGECVNEIVRSGIELAPVGGHTGQQARYDCVKEAGTDCDAAKACIGRIYTTDARCADPASGEPFQGQPRAFCDDDRISVCAPTGSGIETYSCADDFLKQKFGGPFCVPNGEASALCGFGACAAEGGGSFPAPRCEGETLVYCTNGVEQRLSCANSGGVCNPETGKCEQTCSATGLTCSGDEVHRSCAEGASIPLYDCSVRAGWTCAVEDSSTSFGCAPPHDECKWGVFQAECVEGQKIRFCDDGKLSVYDCGDVGATSCQSSPAGVNCKL